MIHPIPPGTRDVLPDEMRELRAISDGLRREFEGAGYGEVWTPSVEYEEVLRRGDERASGTAFRLFDDEGRVLVLRSDMTVPIARMVATRYGDADPPIRLCYFAHAYRAVEPGKGQAREFLQAGVELIGEAAPAGDAEVVALAIAALDAAGLERHRIGLGDANVYRALLATLDVPDDARAALLADLARRNLVGVEMRVERLGLPPRARELLTTLPTLRGGPEVLDRAEASVPEAVEHLRACHELLAERSAEAAERVIFDLGLMLELGYYTGMVFEVYDPAVGFALGSGGRYDELLGSYGRTLPACGFALDVHRVHVARTAEERG